MRTFCLLVFLCPWLSFAQVSPQNASLLKGQLKSAGNAENIADAFLYLVSKGSRVLSDKEGRFQLSVQSFPDTLVISHTGYITRRIRITNASFLDISLEPSSDMLAEVEVQTGYQSLPAERATGSFTKINSELFNRKVGASVLDRLDGIASGLIFNRNRTLNANESAIQIRGRSTILANTEPLIVVDNFPFEGDINQINPNDIESITLLKDAAAASIWGVRAGNGVIVITTKKAKQSAAPKLRFNTNITIGEKPDLFYQQVADGASMVEMESFLFSRGYYNNRINQRFPGLSPAVTIFDDRRSGRVSAADSASQIQQLLQTDNRNDLLRYFYRPSIAQQYALNISGGSERAQYYFSAGWDNQNLSQLQSDISRVTLRSKTQLQLVPGKLDFTTDLNMIISNSNNPSTAYLNSYPLYQRLVDDNGNALPIYKDYRKSWLDTIGQGQLLPWHNRPYDEIRNNSNTTARLDTRLLTSLNWQIAPQWNILFSYQLETGSSQLVNNQNTNSFYTRDQINSFTQLNYQTGIPTRPIPIGNILDRRDQRFTSHNGRIQTTYVLKWSTHHRLDFLAGSEIRQTVGSSSTFRRYGVNDVNATDIDVNTATNFTTLPSNSFSRISLNHSTNKTIDRFISLYGNLGYSFKERYQFTFSARKDASNIFGVNANQQSIPLWSLGAGWSAHKEKWFSSKLINQLKLRLTYGVSGNVDKATTAYTTAALGTISVFSQPTAILLNPPNPDLAWEKIYMLNAGLDFSLLKSRLSGSLEYYIKKGNDLIGNSAVAPQAGVSQFRQNIANLETKGIDFTLNIQVLKSQLNWVSQLLFSYNQDEIKRYLVRPGSTKAYVTSITSNPLEGKPWSAIFGFPWAGLDANTGNPLGWVDGTISSNYNRLVNPLNTSELKYMGTGRPVIFGGLRNDFSYKNWSLSFNTVYSMGYYFRRNSIFYTAAFGSSLSGSTNVHADFTKRWKAPGDQAFTQIPSMNYPSTPSADEFYQYSTALIEKGDHIRLRDIRLTWRLPLKNKSLSFIESVRWYAYVNNVGVLWRANKNGIDPDNITNSPTPRTYAMGVQIDF